MLKSDTSFLININPPIIVTAECTQGPLYFLQVYALPHSLWSSEAVERSQLELEAVQQSTVAFE